MYEHSFKNNPSALKRNLVGSLQLQQRVGNTVVYSGKFSKMISRNTMHWLSETSQRPMIKRIIKFVLSSRFFGMFATNESHNMQIGLYESRIILYICHLNANTFLLVFCWAIYQTWMCYFPNFLVDIPYFIEHGRIPSLGIQLFCNNY